MGVQVDEPGGDGQPSEVDRVGRPVLRPSADEHDPLARDPEVRADGRSAGSVVERGVPEQDVDHRSASAPDVT